MSVYEERDPEQKMLGALYFMSANSSILERGLNESELVSISPRLLEGAMALVDRGLAEKEDVKNQLRVKETRYRLNSKGEKYIDTLLETIHSGTTK